MSNNRFLVFLAAVTVSVMSCAPAGSGSGQSASTQPAAPPSRTLVITNGGEPTLIGPFSSSDLINTVVAPSGMFTAALAATDVKSVTRPVLAQALPKLNTGTWQVFPNGEMETTY